MRHVSSTESTVDTLQIRTPERIMINGQVHLSFRDILYNLILNNLRNIDYHQLNKKAETFLSSSSYTQNKKGQKPISPKHRRRLEKQLRKLSGLHQ